MNKLDTRLREDYERWKSSIAATDPYLGPNTIGVDEVLRAHYLICDFFVRRGEAVAAAGPRDPDGNLLLSALGRQFTSFGGKTKWQTNFELCATLFFGLIRNHPFHDGNKRTAYLVAVLHLLKIGRTPDTSQKDLENLAIRTADNALHLYKKYEKFAKHQDPEVLFIASFMRNHTRDIDNRTYLITFNELDTLLHRFDFSLRNPHKNRIDIMRSRSETTGLVFKKTRIVEERVGNIGFPGWTKQVTRGCVERVRELTGLTRENGVDSQVFFQDADPMQKMIGIYAAPLTRLRDK